MENRDRDDRPQSNRQRPPIGGAQFTQDSPQLLEEVAGDRLNAEQLGHLTDPDHEGEARHEPGQDRPGEEVRDEPQSGDPGQHEDDADHDGQHCAIGRKLGRVAGGERAYCRGGHHRHRRARPHRDLAAGTEQRVHEQRSQRRIESRLRREPGKCPVGHALRYEHRPHGNSGRKVPTQPAALIPGKPSKQRYRRRGCS